MGVAPPPPPPRHYPIPNPSRWVEGSSPPSFNIEYTTGANYILPLHRPRSWPSTLHRVAKTVARSLPPCTLPPWTDAVLATAIGAAVLAVLTTITWSLI